MTEPDRPQLTLSAPPPRLRRPTGRSFQVAVAAVILLQVAVLVFLVVTRPRSGSASSGAAGEDLKAVALKLEDRSLHGEAARAWEGYLSASPEAGERGTILYRVGTLHLKAEDYERAAAAFLRAEVASPDDADLRSKIGPKLVECLRRLGLYGEVGRELSRRVTVGGGAEEGGTVLATFAGEALTEADLDRMIERRVDQALAVSGPEASEERRRALLDQLSSESARRQMLQELIQTELFTRRARELGLDQKDEFLDARDFMEANLLARLYLREELAKIQPTRVDIESYYQAHAKEYTEPESLVVTWTELGAGEDAEEVLSEVDGAEAFVELARSRAPVVEDRQESVLETVFRGKAHPRFGLATRALFDLAPGEWTRQPIEHAGRRFLVLVQERRPERTPPLAEIEDRVRAEYIERKREEMSQRIVQDLTTRYDVRMVAPPEALSPTEGTKEGSGGRDEDGDEREGGKDEGGEDA